MTNVEKLYAKLDEMGANIGGLTLGPNAAGNAEGVAAEILRSLEELENGNFTLVADIGF